MKIGLVIPLNNAAAAAEMAVEAERAGWDGFFVGEAIWSIDPWLALAAAAVRTTRIRLGTMLTPMPLMRPWKLASEAATLDHLSGGRAVLGVGMGATWMGWQAFPDYPTDARTRAEMLDEGIDILDILLRSKQEDYVGKHFSLRLSAMDTMHYPPPSVQQPRLPIWTVGVWPRMKSMRRVLKCDGLIPAVMDADGQFTDLRPELLAEMVGFVRANRTRETPFDVLVEGSTVGLDEVAAREKLLPWREAGGTWWMDTMFGVAPEQLVAHVRRGPPRLE
jgi:hypothetical protein